MWYTEQVLICSPHLPLVSLSLIPIGGIVVLDLFRKQNTVGTSNNMIKAFAEMPDRVW